MENYAEMPRENRIALKNKLIRDKKARRRKEIAKKGISRIMKVKKKDIPKSKIDLDMMVNEIDLSGKNKDKIDVLKKYAY